MNRLVVICYYLLLSHFVLGQSYSFKVVNSDAGLPSNLVFDVQQTSNGRLWVLTGQGICSYDGAQVENYSDNQIVGIEKERWRELKVDDSDRIWLRANSGRVYFLNENLILNEIPGTDTIGSLNFIKTDKNEVQILARKGHYRCNKTDNQLELVHKFTKPLYRSSVLQLSDQKFPKILIPYNSEVIIYDALSGKVQSIIPVSRVRGALLLDDKTILTSTTNYNELFVIDISSKKRLRNMGNEVLQKDANMKTYFRKMMFIDSSRIAISSGYRGLFIYDLSSDEILNFQHNPFDPASISSDNTYFISHGLENNTFVSTRTTGFNMIDFDQKNATHISAFLLANENSIFEGFVSALVKDDQGILWMGSQQGLLKYDPNRNIGTQVHLNLPLDVEPGVRELFKDRNGNIWMGLSSFGLLKINEAGDVQHVFRRQSEEKQRIPSNRIHQIIEDTYGVLQIATSRGVIQIDPEKNVVLENHTIQFPELERQAITSIDHHDNDWAIGTYYNGIYIYRNDNLHRLDVNEGLPSSVVSDILLHSDGRILVGTNGGLCIYKSVDSLQLIASHFDRRILSINEDKQGRIWITLEEGLYLLNDHGVVKFDLDNGFKGGGFRLRASYFDDAENTMYYGTNRGISYFETNHLAKVEETINMWLYSVTSNDSVYYVGKNENVELPFISNTINVDYGHIDIWNQPDLLFEYKLGKSKWQPVYSHPLVLQNVPSGEYTLQMRASVDNTSWQLAKNEIHFTISYPWWRQWWFLTLAAITVMSLGFWISKIILRIRKVRREKHQTEIALSNNLQKVSEIEMKALRSQMNPHFMFNSLNSINSFIMKNDTENASDYLTNFAQLMRVILENSRHEWISLESELNAVRLYIEMEELRFTNQFHYQEEIANNVDISKVMIPPMLIQPYCENAIWHGLLPIGDRECTLKCQVSKQLDYVQILIDDNGIGKLASEKAKSKFKTKKKSYGMRIISERLQMINERYGLDASVNVTDKSTVGLGDSGTQVIIKLKIMNKDRTVHMEV